MGYWPSYSEISSESRGQYLRWLASGRSDPKVEIGHVFLFYYGLERRLLFDVKHKAPGAREEVPIIVAELDRLFGLYGENHSFGGYVSGLLDFVALEYGVHSTRELDLGVSRVSWRMPVLLKVGLARLAKAGKPIGPDWALGWFMHHPSTSLRTPGRRCHQEFRDLFRARYRDRFGDGMKLRPNKTKLSLDYHAASSSLRGTYRAEHPDLPDVEVLKAPLDKLVSLADKVQNELDAYSRWVGRYDEGESLAALALLPAVLVESRVSPEQRDILESIESGLADSQIALVPLHELLRSWPTKKKGVLSKDEARTLAQFLQSLGFGIEPDPRHGGPNPGRSEQVAVFRLEEGDQQLSEDYGWATLVLHLGAAVAAADEDFSSEEEQLLEGHLEESLALQSGERLRLRAHLKWLLAEPPDFRSIRTRTRSLDPTQRAELGRFLILVAAADGRLDAREMATLEKVYPMLGLEASEVHSNVHSLAAGAGPGSRGPVTVLSSEPSSKFPVPARPQEAAPRGVILLDPDRIKNIREDSRKAAELLREVFDDDSEEPADDSIGLSPETDTGSSRFEPLRLGEPETRFLEAVISRLEWSRSEMELVAEEHGIMAGGAIEMINERSFELWDEALLEGGDPIEVNDFLVREYLS